MLYLHPPFVQVAGLTLYPDSERPDVWYYMPNAPRLALDEHGVPVWRLLELRSASGEGGGLLDFDVDLRVDPEVLAEAGRRLRTALHLDVDPVLSPVVVEDGSVRLVVLGTDSGAPVPAGDAGAAPVPGPGATPALVEQVVHAAKPALYGDERAAFSVRLDQAGTTTMLAAMQGEVLPVGVVYSLDVYALRPAYQVSLDVDWDRVQTRLDESFSSDFLVFSSDIRAVVDKLVDERAIVLDVDTFVPEGTKEDEGALAGRDRAVSAVYGMITDAFFKPSVDPAPLKDGWDDALELVEDLGRVGHDSFSYSRLDHTRIDRKRLDVHLRERTTVKRTVYPQGHLSSFVAELSAAGLTPADLVTKVELDDPWFTRREVQVVPSVDFSSGHVASVDVTLAYAGDHRSLHLVDATPQTVSWPSTVVDGRVVEPVEVTYTVNLVRVDHLQRPLSISGTVEPVLGDVLTLRATDLFSLPPVTVSDDGIPWDRWDKVVVDLALDDAAHGISQQATLVLDPTSTSWTWRPYVVGDVPPLRRTLTFHRSGQPPLVVPESSAPTLDVRVGDPRPHRRSLQVVPNLPWASVAQAFVDLTYVDPANGVEERASLSFSEADPAPKAFTVDLLDPRRRVVGYDVTIVRVDGSVRTVAGCSTVGPRLLLSPDAPRHVAVAVRADAAAFAARGVAAATVTLTLPGGPTGQVVLTAAEPDATWELDAPEGPLEVTWSASLRHANGLSATRSGRVVGTDVTVPLT